MNIYHFPNGAMRALALGVVASLAFAVSLTVPGYGDRLLRVSDLTDAPPSHWAYEALQTLVEKYSVLQGEPDGAFHGDRPLTRWEMAAALRDVAQQMGRDMARLGAEKADRADLQTLARLQEAFRTELNALSTRTNTLQTRAATMEAKNEEQDARLSLLEKTTLHGDFTIGALANMGASNGRSSTGGLRDSLETISRLRLTLDTPVIADHPDSRWGAGVLSTRLIAGLGVYANNQRPAGRGADYSFNMYSRVAADASPHSDGLFIGGTNGLLGRGATPRPSAYVESMFYRQKLKAGIPLLTDWTLGRAPAEDPQWQATGDLYAGLIRWWDLFDVSPYRGNELTQFQNNAFVNIPGVAVNIVQPMVAYQWHQGLGKSANLDVGAALGSYTVGNLADGLNLTYEARLNYTPQFLGDRFAKPGSVYAGAYHLFNAGNTDSVRSALANASNRNGNSDAHFFRQTTGHAVYAGWNQEWMRGVGTHVGYLLNNSSGNIIGLTTLQPGTGAVFAGARQSLAAVLSVPASAFGLEGAHAKDALGFGYAFSDLHEGGLSGLDFSDGFEHVMEAYYRYQLNDAVSVIPSWQLILNRLGLKAHHPVTVLGVRLNCVF